MKRFHLLLITFFLSSQLFATEAEKNFFNSIQPISYIRGYLPHDSIFVGYNGNGLILRTEYKGWLFIGEGNGVVCQLDSDKWKRLDDTYFRGYDFGCYPFKTGGIAIYKYGGYGFWKTNGILTCFDYKKKEWEIVNTDRELPNVNRYCYFDEETKQLFQLGSLTFNQADNNANYIDSVFVLNLDERIWHSRGKINVELDSVNPARVFEPTGITLPSKNGFLFVSEKSTPFLLDFKKMTVSFFSESGLEKIHELFRQTSNTSLFTVVQEKKISLIDRNTLEEKYSVNWNDLTIGLKTIDLIQPSISRTNYHWPFYGSGLLIVLIGVLTYKAKRKRQGNLKETGEVKVNEKTISSYLTAEEFLVLKTIIEDQNSGTAASTLKINEILGIENRTLDGQKNYRSDVIKSINSKIRLNERLDFDPIVRERSSEDKRMMSYICTLEIEKAD